MSQARNDEQLLVSQANIAASSQVIEYSRVMGVASEGTRTSEDGEPPRGLTERSTSGNDVAGKKLNNTESLMMRRSSSEDMNEALRNNDRCGMLHEEPLQIQCGEKTALLYVSKLCQGSKGPCILYGNEWLTPNELQYICGRETAKDWKRSIRHKGKSLKSLIAQGFLKVHPPICDCPGCRVSSPVNRSRLADKCGFSKIPSYLTDKSMVKGLPTMWRRNSTSSDEPDQPNSLQGSLNFADDESEPKRSHSDEPRYYRSSDQIQVSKRPRSSSPDLDRGHVNLKRRCMSETSADERANVPGTDIKVNTNFSPSAHQALPFDVEDPSRLERKRETIDHEVKREQHRSTAAARSTLRRDLPVLTLPSSAYSADVLYARNQAHLGLHRHVTSPRLLSPSFVRPAASPSAQIRLLHEQTVAPLSSHIYAQQLRQEYPSVGMATMFPYSFTHPVPNSQLLSTHFQKLSPEMQRHIANTSEQSIASPNSNKKQEDKNNGPAKDNELESEITSSPGSDGLSSLKEPGGPSTADKSYTSSLEANFKFGSEEPEDQGARTYPELAQIAAQWDVEEVCKFVNSVTGCNEYCDVFREQEIDGQALILLTEEHLSSKMGIKLGPALKIKAKIDELRCVYTK